MDLKDLLLKSVKSTSRHFDGSVFTMNQASGREGIPLPPGVYKIFHGGEDIVLGKDEQWFLYHADTKMYMETIQADPEMKARLNGAEVDNSPEVIEGIREYYRRK